MGFFKNIVVKLGAAESKPTVRVRGVFRWSRRLTVYAPSSDNPSIWSKPIRVEDVNFKFNIGESKEGSYPILCDGETVCVLNTKEDALELMEKIANALAPSKFRLARRFFVAWLVFYIFFPSQKQQIQQPVPMQMVRQVPAVAPYAAPQVERPAYAPAVSAQAPGSPQVGSSRSGEPQNVDPFGLQLGSEGK